ncbi:hypothetical protein C3L33_16250, partial [Rhododendron williamsianum]
MDLYFKRHDGQAVTREVFFAAMRDANDADFATFLLWYSQTGTLLVKVTSSYDAEAHTYSLKFIQEVLQTPGQPVKERKFIPVAVGLLDSSGKDMPLSSVYQDGKLESVACGDQAVYSAGLKITKVVAKWFSLQAMSKIPGNVESVRKLLSHPAFDLYNPKKVYALIGGCCGSPVNFHATDGSGYKFFGEMVVQLDKLNPQVASRMVLAFSRWKRCDETRQSLTKAHLEIIMSANGLSENMFEIASKCLAA